MADTTLKPLPSHRPHEVTLDDLLAEQQAGTYVDPVWSAKQFLAKPQEELRRQGDVAAAKEQTQTASENNIWSGVKNAFREHPLSMLKDVALSAALPVSFGAGTPAMVADTAFALEG